MQPGVPSFSASANVAVRKFVKISGSFLVAQCVANEIAFGVSGLGARDTPIPGGSTSHALTGDPVRVFGHGESCPMNAGASITAGQFLKPDANGDPVPCATGNQYSAQALETQTTVGAQVQVFVCRGVAP